MSAFLHFMLVLACQSVWLLDVMGQSTVLCGQDLLRSSTLNLA
jgi:hypothetical protein